MVTLKIVNKSTNELPTYATTGSAGIDLKANLNDIKDIDSVKGMDFDLIVNIDDKTIGLKPGGRALIPTGLYMQIPEGYVGDVRPRSGLALKEGITVLNADGTIDSDYRGEVGVILYNASNSYKAIKHGDRIAQLIISPYKKALIVEFDKLDDTSRGEGGFGSTGKK